MQQTDSVTKTRTTRMIYVEEISDTERRNSTFKSFESETTVEDITKSTKTSPRNSSKTPSEGTSHQPNVTSLQEGSSPGKTMTSPDVPTSPEKVTSPEKLTRSTEMVMMSPEKSLEKVAQLPETGPSPRIENEEKDGKETEECKSPDVKAEEEPPKLSENVVPNETNENIAEKKIEIEPSKEPTKDPLKDNSTNQSAGGIGDVTTSNGNVNALPELRKFSKMASVVPSMPASKRGWAMAGVGRIDSEGGGSNPPSRTGTRKDLFLAMKSKRAFQAMDDMKTIVDSLLYETLRPLLFCMKCSGIFFVRKNGRFGKSPRECLRSFTPLQMYCLFMVIILTLNFIRLTMAFDPDDGFGNTLFLKFLTAIFMYESSSRAALAYMHSYRKTKGLSELFLALEKVCYSDSIIPYERPLRNVMHGSIVISILISLSNMACNAYGMFGPAQEQFDSYLIPVSPQAPGIEALKVFVLILVLINGMVAMLSLSFFTVICYVLYKEFEYFCRTFIMKLRDDGSFVDDLEKFRITHQKRCKLVEDADSMFKYYIANTYMTNVPLLCILLYVIVYAEDSDVTYRLINAFRLFYVLVQMVVVSVAATLINNQAHGPLADIYSIRVQSATIERQLEVNMFLNKLTGTSIGLTAWDMFVINKPTVLTVVGMVLTYFFLLVQFKNPLSAPTECRCMVNVSSEVLQNMVMAPTTEVMVTTVN